MELAFILTLVCGAVFGIVRAAEIEAKIVRAENLARARHRARLAAIRNETRAICRAYDI